MAALCLTTAAGVVAAAISVPSFTLSWTHSVEKIEWQEDWRLAEDHLVPVAARVRGSGAGMEPAADAVFADGWWRYAPRLGAQERLVLARSRFTEDYRLCWAGACRPLADWVPLPEVADVTIVRPCGAAAAPSP